VEIVCSIQPYGYLINEVISFENCTKGELLTTSFDAVDLDIKSIRKRRGIQEVFPDQ